MLPHLEQLHELVVGEGVEDDNVGHPTVILPVCFVDRRKVAEALVLPLAPPAPKHAAQHAPLLLRLAILHTWGQSLLNQAWASVWPILLSRFQSCKKQVKLRISQV